MSGDPLEVASKLLEEGAQTAIITLAAEGGLVVRGEDQLRVWAPKVRVVDSCDAGATYTVGFIFGQLQGWSLEETVRFATAATSIKCALIAMRVSPVAEVRRLAENVRVERW